MFPDLLLAQKFLYEKIELQVSQIMHDSESSEYGACTFVMGNKIIKFRAGKITPKKCGQFVTFWKRNESGIIIPYDIDDAFDFLIISARRDEKQFGQFVFPKNLLLNQKILSKDGQGGRRALRIYPPWDSPDSKQAQKTQNWQTHYFIEIHQHKLADTALAEKLFLTF